MKRELRKNMRDFACPTCGSLRFTIIEYPNGDLEIQCILCNFKLRFKSVEEKKE